MFLLGWPRSFAVRLALAGGISIAGLLADVSHAQPSTGREATTPAVVSPARNAPRAAAKPAWTELTARQQAALTPLGAHWADLSETQKLKWIALSRNYDKLPETEQAKLQERMTDWAGLSNQQRTQARQNFAETRKLPADEKKARWEAYQALSEEERGKLANANKPVRPTGVAAVIQPVPQPRLTRVPPPEDPQQPRPRIGVKPSDLDHNTLLPQQRVAPTPAASR